jgi:hypothetical protein
MSEAQFLDEQADNAHAAIGRILTEIKSDSAHVIDPRIWAKAHPWATVTAAAVAGFVAGDLLRRPDHARAREPESSEPPSADSAPKERKKTANAAHFIVTAVKRTRAIIAFLEPFLAELWAAQAARHNGQSPASDPQSPPQPPPHSTVDRI